MFKNTRLSAMLAAVLFSVTAASALVSAPAFADAPAGATAPAASDRPTQLHQLRLQTLPPLLPKAAAPAAPAAAGTKEEVTTRTASAMWAEGDFVNKGTIIILSLMSMGSWYIIITKLLDQSKIMRQSKEASQKFWKAPSIAAGSAQLKDGSPFRFIAETGTKATQHHDGALLEQIDLSTWVTMQIQRAVEKVQSRLQDGLSFLATVGSTSPFIGLFGTVWGIYNALTAIGMSGNASIDKVAGPVGEALIMTAFGLFVAVPAVLGYNWLVRRNKSAMEDVRSFSADVHSVLISGAMSTSEAARAAGAKKLAKSCQ
jgi:biopolymer transport protein ExbB